MMHGREARSGTAASGTSTRSSAGRTPAVHAGEPRIGAESVRVDVVHPGRIPADAARRENRAWQLALGIVGRCQLLDLERTDVEAIAGIAALRKAQDPVAVDDDAARGPGANRVVGDDRARGVLLPRPEQVTRPVEPQLRALLPAGEQPPAAGCVERAGIDERTGDQLGYALPFRRERPRAVQAHAFCTKALRHEVDLSR